MTIRPAIVADFPFMRNLEQLCPTAAHWTEQQYLQLFQVGIEPERLVLVAQATGITPQDSKLALGEGNLLGFLVARRVATEWELENVVVSPDARRKGIGKRLLEALLARARETNSDSVFLEVRESNGAAKSLYEKLGFRETGRRKSYYTNPLEDAVLYTRSLVPR